MCDNHEVTLNGLTINSNWFKTNQINDSSYRNQKTWTRKFQANMAHRYTSQTLYDTCASYIYIRFQSYAFHAYGKFLFDEHIIMANFEAARLRRAAACKKSFWFCSVSFFFSFFSVLLTAQCTYEVRNYWRNLLPLNLIWNIEQSHISEDRPMTTEMSQTKSKIRSLFMCWHK